MRHLIGLAVLLELIVTAAPGNRVSAQVPSPNPAFNFDTGHPGGPRLSRREYDVLCHISPACAHRGCCRFCCCSRTGAG